MCSFEVHNVTYAFLQENIKKSLHTLLLYGLCDIFNWLLLFVAESFYKLVFL